MTHSQRSTVGNHSLRRRGVVSIHPIRHYSQGVPCSRLCGHFVPTRSPNRDNEGFTDTSSVRFLFFSDQSPVGTSWPSRPLASLRALHQSSPPPLPPPPPLSSPALLGTQPTSSSSHKESHSSLAQMHGECTCQWQGLSRGRRRGTSETGETTTGSGGKGACVLRMEEASESAFGL